MRALLALIALLFARPAFAQGPVDRDYVYLVGVPQVLKYADAVSSAISKTTHQKYPLLENMTAGTAARIFCGGLARNKPDLYLISSSSSAATTAGCKANGVNHVLRLPLGHDAMIVVGAAGQKPFNLSRRTLYLALAARVPSTDEAFGNDKNPLGTVFVANRFTRWNQIDPALPDMPIHILAPSPQSVDWWGINDMVMRDGCRAVRPVAAMEKVSGQLYGGLCYNRRTDGVIRYATEQGYWDDPVLHPSDPADVAIERYSVLKQVGDGVVLPVEGLLPNDTTIGTGKFALSRLVTLYVKTEKYPIVPGLQQYVVEMTSPQAAGPGGYLTKLGLVPLPDAQLREVSVAARFATE